MSDRCEDCGAEAVCAVDRSVKWPHVFEQYDYAQMCVECARLYESKGMRHPITCASRIGRRCDC